MASASGSSSANTSGVCSDEKLKEAGGVSGTAGLKRKNKPDAKEKAEILASQGRIDKFLKKIQEGKTVSEAELPNGAKYKMVKLDPEVVKEAQTGRLMP